MAQPSLKNTTVRGVGWSFADSMVSQGITFLVGIVLARLLSPEEYGLLGIMMIFVLVSESIVNSGLSSALTRKQDTTELDYNTVFVTNFVLSIVMYLVLFFGAPWIADFFDKPQLTELLRVLGVVVIINSFSLVPNTKLIKAIDFKTQMLCSLAAAILSGIVGISMAYMGTRRTTDDTTNRLFLLPVDCTQVAAEDSVLFQKFQRTMVLRMEASCQRTHQYHLERDLQSRYR